MKVKVTPIGHATVLIELGDFCILTDPVFSETIGVSLGFSTIGSPRLQPPAMAMKDLPDIDLVLLSHGHFDHCDKPSLRKLSSHATVLVHRNNKGLVRRFKDKRELQWGDSTWIQRNDEPFLQVTGTPARHWGARMLVDAWRGYGGFLLEIPSVPSPFQEGEALSIFFAGDTAYTKVFQQVRRDRQGVGVDLAMMPIGAYNPWIRNHCNPEQAWSMAMHDLGAHRFMPMHYGVFSLSNEPLEEPMQRLRTVASQEGMLDKLVGDSVGASFSLL